MPAPRFDYYDWPGGREAMLRLGMDDAPAVIVALPLFEEANRTRASVVSVLRRLAARGIASALPDLPGTNDSLVPTHDATLTAWRAAFAAAAATLPKPVHVVAWRGGALVDAEAEVASRWHLSPVSGADTLRELRRVRAASGGALYAGNRLRDVMLAELEGAEFLPRSAHLRTVRLDTDRRPADHKRSGRPLWRSVEPGNDPVLETALADDIAAWIMRCGT